MDARNTVEQECRGGVVIRILTLVATICIFAIASRGLAIYLFDHFIFDINREGEGNEFIRVLCHIGGVIAGGAIGVAIHKRLLRRPTQS